MDKKNIMAKRGRPSAKDTQAKKKVAELLSDIDLTSKQKKDVVSKVVELEKKSGDEWIEGELDRVTSENESLRRELAKLKEASNDAPQTGSAPVADNITQQQARNLFKEMEGLLLGRNRTGKRYPQVETKLVLDRMLHHFPFMMNKK